MSPTKFRKSLAFFLALVMLFVALPNTALITAMADSEVYPVMEKYTASSSSDYHKYYSQVYSVTFTDKLDYSVINASDTIDSWDVSENKDNSVIAWMKLNSEQTILAGKDLYDVYIGGEGGVGANPESSHLFYSFTALEEVKGLENFKTSEVTTFSNMFGRCLSLERIDLSTLDTSNVKNLSNLFYYCKALLEVDFSGWDTSNVTDMSYMFRNCISLPTLDLRSFDTSKVTNMTYLFYRCESLGAVYVSEDWSIENVENGLGVFNCCYALVGGIENYDGTKIDYTYATTDENGLLTYKAKDPVKATYTVTYVFTGDIPDSQPIPSSFKTEEGTVITVLKNPSQDGYKFSGWTSSDADISSGTFTLSQDVTITGNWEKLYSVRYLYTGDIPENAPSLPEYSYTAGTVVEIDDKPELNGYTFIGWSSDDISTADRSFTMPSKDVVLYGYFKKPVESVTIPNGDITANVGEETSIIVIVNPEDATVKELVYSSDDEAVVKVDENGKITAVGEGTAIITVYSKDDPSKKDTVTVTVKVPVSDIEITNTVPVLNVGEEALLDVDINPDNATIKELVYYSDDEAVVKIDENGKITAVGEGTATITVYAKDDPSKKDTVTVTVKVPVSDIEITNTVPVLNVGEETLLDVDINPDNATIKELVYSSDDEAVVKVDENGKITAVGEGTATITVYAKDDPSKKDTIEVTVKVPVSDVVINAPLPVLNVGEEATIDITVTPDNATDRELIFTSDNEAVVTVDKNGKVTAIGKGTATITVYSKDNPSKKDTITVTVTEQVTVTIPVEEIIINNDFSIINIGEKTSLDVTVNPDNATHKDLIFMSDDESILSVDENGNVTALKEGTATITVFSKYDPSKKDSVTVTVKVPVKDIEITNSVPELFIGDEAEINISITPDNATDKDLVFISDNEAVVKVDKNGKITAIGEGTANITVYSKENGSIKDTVTVTVKKYIPVTNIELSGYDSSLSVGETTEIITKLYPENASNSDLVFSSDDESILTVDSKGKITAIGTGTATVTVISKDNPDIIATATITVTEPEYTLIYPESVTVTVGQLLNLGVKIYPENSSLKISYFSSDTSVITVDKDGNIIGVAPGSTTIIATLANGYIAVIPVTVIAAPVKTKHHICFGKTDGIGWYEVSINGGDFFPQGPNSTLEVEEGDVLVIRVQDMWIDDEFDFYVNGLKVPMEAANTITVVVDGYMLIGALSMDIEVPDVEESISLIEKIIIAIKKFFDMIVSWFK